MKVLKFGGTSVGSVESLLNVKRIVEEIQDSAIIVVSALGGITDRLIATAEAASRGDNTWEISMKEITERHFKIINEVIDIDKQREVKDKVTSQLNGLIKTYEGVYLLRSLPANVLDSIVSFGERMSSVIVSALIKNGKRYYSPDFIKTEKRYGKDTVDVTATDKLLKETFSQLEDKEKAIVPGFISSDKMSGEITNLGRGGSDYTGALIAAALGAEVLEIWTDVDGFLTADPRVVDNPLLIPCLSFSESMELCTFGAKVIYPPTIFPVYHKNIPIKILNTFNPEASGSLISDYTADSGLPIKGVSSLKGVSILTLIMNKISDIDIPKRAFNNLSKNGVRIIPIANPEPSVELNFAVLTSDVRNSLLRLNEEFAPEISSGLIKNIGIRDNLCAVAIVGNNMRQQSRLIARIGHTLRRNGINVEAYSPLNSETTFVFIINQEKSSDALPLIHSMIFRD